MICTIDSTFANGGVLGLGQFGRNLPHTPTVVDTPAVVGTVVKARPMAAGGGNASLGSGVLAFPLLLIRLIARGTPAGRICVTAVRPPGVAVRGGDGDDVLAVSR